MPWRPLRSASPAHREAVWPCASDLQCSCATSCADRELSTGKPWLGWLAGSKPVASRPSISIVPAVVSSCPAIAEEEWTFGTSTAHENNKLAVFVFQVQWRDSCDIAKALLLVFKPYAPHFTGSSICRTTGRLAVAAFPEDTPRGKRGRVVIRLFLLKFIRIHLPAAFAVLAKRKLPRRGHHCSRSTHAGFYESLRFEAALQTPFEDFRYEPIAGR